MKVEELRKMSLLELAKLTDNLKESIIELRIEFSKGKKEGNSRQLRTAKKDLARVLTIINEKEQND